MNQHWLETEPGFEIHHIIVVKLTEFPRITCENVSPKLHLEAVGQVIRGPGTP